MEITLNLILSPSGKIYPVRIIRSAPTNNVPLNKFCDPQQIAEMCDYLLGRSGDNITGSKFVIDGGETL